MCTFVHLIAPNIMVHSAWIQSVDRELKKNGKGGGGHKPNYQSNESPLQKYNNIYCLRPILFNYCRDSFSLPTDEPRHFMAVIIERAMKGVTCYSEWVIIPSLLCYVEYLRNQFLYPSRQATENINQNKTSLIISYN